MKVLGERRGSIRASSWCSSDMLISFANSVELPGTPFPLGALGQPVDAHEGLADADGRNPGDDPEVAGGAAPLLVKRPEAVNEQHLRWTQPPYTQLQGM